MGGYEPSQEDYDDLFGMMRDPNYMFKKMNRKTVDGYQDRSDLFVPPVHWEASRNSMDWNSHELSDALVAYSCVVIKDSLTTDYLIHGDGVRLRLPFMWLFDMGEEELNASILNGIKASRDHREVLGY